MHFARVATQRGFVPPAAREVGLGPPALPAARDLGRADHRRAAESPSRSPEMSEPDVSSGWTPRVLAAILPRIYPQMLDEVHSHQDAGRATFIVSAAGNDMVKALAAVLGMEGGTAPAARWARTGKYTGRVDGPFRLGRGKVEAMEAFAAEHGNRPGGLVRLLGLDLRPAHAASGRPRGGRQPRSAPGRDSPRRGLGGDALRESSAAKLAIAGATVLAVGEAGAPASAVATHRGRWRRSAPAASLVPALGRCRRHRERAARAD